MAQMFKENTTKLSKGEKADLGRLSPRPSVRGTVEQKIVKIKDL